MKKKIKEFFMIIQKQFHPLSKERILFYFPFLVLFWFGNKLSQLYRYTYGQAVLTKLIQTIDNLDKIFLYPFPSFYIMDILLGVCSAAGTFLFLYYKKKHAKKYRQGREYGSARWGGAKDIKPFIDPVFENNILLTQTERIMLGRNKIPKYNINKNVLVIGGSGSGKTRFHIKPNLMQMNSSFVVTDPKGTVLLECGKMLEEGGYKIKILNTINFKQSMHYNPFEYIRGESDILKLVNAFIENTKNKENKGGDDFWVKAEALYYQALIGYIYYEAPKEEKNMLTLLEMINASETREDDEDFKNPVDILFENLEKKDPGHFAVRQYKKYKLAAGKTAKSILISCGARLAPFDIKEVRDIMAYDEMEIEKLGEEKTALFVIVSDTDMTFNFISAIFYTQMFHTLCDVALEKHQGSLPIHVTCLLDEFANQVIPNFQHLISVIRSRNISAHVVLQTQSQLKAIYKDDCETIIGNCSCVLFLGGKERSTLKEISETLGKETIDLMNTSDTRSNQRSFGMNYQKLGRELMTVDELAVMDGGKCILQVQGVRPFYSEKFDITRHPQYKKLSDYHEKNTFDLDKYLHRKLKLKPNDEFECYEMDKVN